MSVKRHPWPTENEYATKGEHLSLSPSWAWFFPSQRRKGFEEEKAWQYALYHIAKKVVEDAGVSGIVRVEPGFFEVDDEIRRIIMDKNHDNRRPLTVIAIDRVLKANGLPVVRRFLEEALKLTEDNDLVVVPVEEFADRLGTSVTRLIIAYAILVKTGLRGIHYYTSREPKYRLPPRGIGFDSFVIDRKTIKGNFCSNSGVCYRHCFEDLKKKLCGGS